MIMASGNLRSPLLGSYFVFLTIASVSENRMAGIFTMGCALLFSFLMGYYEDSSIVNSFYINSNSHRLISKEATFVTVFWLGVGMFANFTIVFGFVKRSLMEYYFATQSKEKLEKLFLQLRKELRFAGNIQNFLLPKKETNYEGFSISTWYRPLNEVGGDTFGLVSLGKKQYRFFMVDASGHGIEAALMTLLIRGEILKIIHLSIPINDILKKFNQSFVEDYHSLGYFCTISLLEIDLNKNRLNYCSAGHPSQYLSNGDDWIRLQTYGKIIGLMKESDYEIQSVDLKQDFAFFLFTDGVYEEVSDDGSLYGEERLERDFLEMRSLPPSSICEAIESNIEEHRSLKGYRDDILLVIGKSIPY